ncbi:thioredoxin-related transmembrane protein 1 [Erpetoichthys calabaricus]|uniref:thioredoxin-related transmembrane protein 1 n=1 Tax=Erpetoichthys calabaricus TaxID=27687 RepID=UPI0022340B56|nr:thioredoxin-related transmembrane protein 1 [Erpetoichthys calabaricus]
MKRRKRVMLPEMMCGPRSSVPLLLIFTVLLSWPLLVEVKEHHIRAITDNNWKDILEGEWMIEFYAPWCPACQQLQKEWADFAEWGEDLDVNIAKVDVTEQPGLSGRFVITALPTIYHCKDGAFRKYQGSRTKNDFINFIDEKKWQEIKPVSSWFGPSSLAMNVMSGLFKLSMFIRHCHNYLTENVGIPVWGSYAIFALVTLFSGLTLGLILVFVADCVFPTHRYSVPAYQQKRHAQEQARLRNRLEAEQEADVEDDEEDEDDYKDRRGVLKNSDREEESDDKEMDWIKDRSETESIEDIDSKAERSPKVVRRRTAANSGEQEEELPAEQEGS